MQGRLFGLTLLLPLVKRTHGSIRTSIFSVPTWSARAATAAALVAGALTTSAFLAHLPWAQFFSASLERVDLPQPGWWPQDQFGLHEPSAPRPALSRPVEVRREAARGTFSEPPSQAQTRSPRHPRVLVKRAKRPLALDRVVLSQARAEPVPARLDGEGPERLHRAVVHGPRTEAQSRVEMRRIRQQIRLRLRLALSNTSKTDQYWALQPLSEEIVPIAAAKTKHSSAGRPPLIVARKAARMQDRGAKIRPSSLLRYDSTVRVQRRAGSRGILASAPKRLTPTVLVPPPVAMSPLSAVQLPEPGPQAAERMTTHGVRPLVSFSFPEQEPNVFPLAQESGSARVVSASKEESTQGYDKEVGSDQMLVQQAAALQEVSRPPEAKPQEPVSPQPRVTTHSSVTTQSPLHALSIQAPVLGSLTSTPLNHDKSSAPQKPDLIIQPGHLRVAAAPREMDTHGKGVTPLADFSLPESAVGYVEAFTPSEPVFGAETRALSFEGRAAGGQRRWVISRAPDHWETLSLDPAQARPEPIPLLSSNNVSLLAAAHRHEIAPDAGIVLARAPRGASVHLSGRAEKAIRIEDGQGDSFVFINAEPGAHLVSFSVEGKRGSVALPVMSAKASYIDLRRIKTRQLHGTVLDADVSAESPRPLRDVRLTVVGQKSESTTTTDGSGQFAFDVVTVEGHPLYIESDVSGGFTHRHAVAADGQTSGVTLYRFGSRRLESLAGQLQGGLSAHSGWVMAALPGLVAEVEEEGDQLFPRAHTLDARASLSPESYALDVRDKLRENTPLSPQAPRFAVAQVPEGLTLLEAEDKGQRVRWSQLVIASPGVVNVVGP